MVVCRSCCAENPAGQRFCSQCGSPLAVSCPACAGMRRPDERFCGDCGAPLGAAALVGVLNGGAAVDLAALDEGMVADDPAKADEPALRAATGIPA